jgi:diguanylate cyclase (GGDEF)-like protein
MPANSESDSAYQPLIDQALAARDWLIALPEVFQPRYGAEQLAGRRPNNRIVAAAAIVFNVQLESRDRRFFLLRTSEAISRAALAARNRGLLAETQTDGLTGVANRRCFDDTFREIWAQALETGVPLSLIIMDIDHFKSFNDLYGHQGGDDCLRLVAAAGRREIRASDLFARYGGEEFAAILPGAPLDTAISIAERIRAAVFALNQRHDGQGETARVTVSLGAAVMQPTPKDDPRRLIERADANLYAAKRAGRNRVVAPTRAPPTGGTPDSLPATAQLLDFKRSTP